VPGQVQAPESASITEWWADAMLDAKTAVGGLKRVAGKRRSVSLKRR
jgi:hypothetical protein